jgi:dTDP-4-amino-4,6-dideoxygalactose transaminase
VRREPFPPFRTIGSEERRLALEVLDSGVLSDFVAHHGPHFNGGEWVKALEAEYGQRFGVKHAISVNSATSGIHASVLAALVGFGDEVIVPPFTMSATATMIAAANATPVFADIDPDSYCLDVNDVKRKLSPRTKAILAVNLFGGPAALDELRSIADEHALHLIEDNAQAPGAKRKGRYAGTVGHMGIFSLNFHKTIHCGEGGVVVTDDDDLADRLRLVRNHGEVVQSQRPSVPAELMGLLGFNYRLTELQAAVALAQVRRLDELTEPRIAIADRITSGLRGMPGIYPPAVGLGDKHVYYVYPIRIEPETLGLSRNQVNHAMDAEGLPMPAGYTKPIYLYPMYRSAVGQKREGFGAGLWHPQPGSPATYERGACPVTERMYFEQLLHTTVCRHDLPLSVADEVVTGFAKILEHRDGVRRACMTDGIA